MLFLGVLFSGIEVWFILCVQFLMQRDITVIFSFFFFVFFSYFFFFSFSSTTDFGLDFCKSICCLFLEVKYLFCFVLVSAISFSMVVPPCEILLSAKPAKLLWEMYL